MTSFANIPVQLVILEAVTSHGIKDWPYTQQSNIPRTPRETERRERYPAAGTHHKVDNILTAFISPLCVWLRRLASFRCWASRNSLQRLCPLVNTGTFLQYDEQREGQYISFIAQSCDVYLCSLIRHELALPLFKGSVTCSGVQHNTYIASNTSKQ
jgi:hypothetical protein